MNSTIDRGNHYTKATRDAEKSSNLYDRLMIKVRMPWKLESTHDASMPGAEIKGAMKSRGKYGEPSSKTLKTYFL